MQVLKGPYRGDQVDIWSCAVLLFVLLAGNTPWDEPTRMSWEFEEFRRSKGRPTYEPWPSLPANVLCEAPCGGFFFSFLFLEVS